MIVIMIILVIDRQQAVELGVFDDPLAEEIVCLGEEKVIAWIKYKYCVHLVASYYSSPSPSSSASYYEFFLGGCKVACLLRAFVCVLYGIKR